MADRDRSPPPLPKKKKPKPPPVYVEVRYPAWLGIASFAWTLAGWFVAALAPHLAFVPLIGLLNYVFPVITVALIGVNLLFAVRDLTRGAHPLRLLLVTGLQVGLFTTLYFQIFAHLGAEHYAVDGPVSAWQWVVFSFAHALRASDLVDVVEAYNLHIQPIKHDSVFVAVFVIVYHIVIDVFVLGVLWNVINRIRRRLLKDDDIRRYTIWAGVILFSLWLLVWIMVAFVIHRWSAVDVPLWLLENVLRVFDFGDIMESFEIRLHGLPREGINGTLTFLCRVWIAIGVAWLLGRKKKPAEKRVLTPPDEAPFPYWSKRVGMVVGILLAVLIFGMLVQAVVGDPASRLTAAVSEGPEGRTIAALAGLRRMGPTAAAETANLAAARANVAPAIRDEITRTLGYMGTKAIKPLEQIAQSAKPGEEASAVIAVEGLGRIGPETGAKLVEIWSTTPFADVKEAADQALHRLGSDAVPVILAASNDRNADAHFEWCPKLDRNWTLRSTTNPVALALQEMPTSLEQLKSNTRPAVFDQLRKCGSAAKRATPEALKRLQDPDKDMQRAAAQFVSAMGPSNMPEVLRQAEAVDLAKTEALVALLMNDSMWDEASLKDPRAVVIATRMLDLPKEMDHVKQFGLDLLAKVGGGSRDLVPKLVVMLGDDDEERRKAIRETLEKIDPKWKTHPDNCRAIPALTPRLARLLADEAIDEAIELSEALGDLQPQDVDTFVTALAVTAQTEKKKKWVSDQENKDVKEVAVKDGKVPGKYPGHPVLELMQRRAIAALPALCKIMASRSNEDRSLGFSIRFSLRNMGLSDAELRVALAAALEWSHDWGTIEYLKEFKDFKTKLIPLIGDLLDHKDEQYRHLGLVMALEMAPEAKSLIPKVIPRLAEPNVATAYGNASEEAKKGSRELTLSTLKALDKDWAKHSSVKDALAPLIADAGPYHDQRGEIRPIYKLLAELGPAARPSVPDIIRTMVVSKSYPFAYDSALALNKIDKNWRDDPTVKEVLPKVIAKFAKGADGIAKAHLDFLGPAAVAELEKALPTFSVEVRASAASIIGKYGGSTDTVATLFKQLSDPKVAAKETGSVLKSLVAMNRDWPTLPEVRKATPEVLAKLATQETYSQYFAVAVALGPVCVPDLLKQLAETKGFPRQLALGALSEIGPPAASALPAVVKALKDKDAEVRKRAVHAVGRIGAGKKDVVSALAPAFLDPDSEVFRNVPDAMDRLDKDWKKSAKLNPVVNQLVKSLGNPDPKVRGIALYSLSFIGPAPGVVAAVERLAKQEKDGNVKQQAMNVLDSLKRGY